MSRMSDLISPDVQDTLLAQAASTELIQTWADLENKLLEHRSNNREPLLIQARYSSILFIGYLCESIIELPPQAWFEAALLLDVLDMSSAEGIAVQDLPEICIILAVSLKKIETADFQPQWPNLVAHASQLAEHLEFHGVHPPEVTPNSLRRMELRVLSDLGWSLSVPTVEKWMTAFCTRLITYKEDPGCMHHVSWVWQCCIAKARFFVTRQAASPNCKPRSLAQGLFCTALLATGILPVEALRPAEMESQQWVTLAMAALSYMPPSQGTNDVQASEEQTLREVMDATGSELAMLKQDTADILLLMQQVHSES